MEVQERIIRENDGILVVHPTFLILDPYQPWREALYKNFGSMQQHCNDQGKPFIVADMPSRAPYLCSVQISPFECYFLPDTLLAGNAQGIIEEIPKYYRSPLRVRDSRLGGLCMMNVYPRGQKFSASMSRKKEHVLNFLMV